MIINRAERTIEHRASTREIVRHFGDGLLWRAHVPKRTVLQDAAREGMPVDRLTGRAAVELRDAYAALASRVEAARALA